MKRFLLLLLLLPLLVSAQETVDTPSPLSELIGDSGFKQPAPKETPLAEKLEQLLEQLQIKRTELEAEQEEEENTGEKLEQATEEVGKALDPIPEAIDWLSGLPGYWEAFLVGGIALIILFFVYLLINLLSRLLMKRRGHPDWKMPRRFGIFLRLLLLSIAVMIAVAWVNQDDSWLYTAATTVASLASAFLAINLGSMLLLERDSKKRKKKIPVLFQQVIRGLLYILAVVAVMGASTGLDLSAVLASSAMLSLVLGLALQDTLGNIFSGMSLHGSKPFEIGDWVEIKEYVGQVVQMNWREVRLRTFERDFVVLPNSMISASHIYNYSHPTKHHIVQLDIGTSYADPPDLVRRVVRQVLSDVEEIEPAQRCLFLVNYNDFSVDYKIRFVIDDYSQVPRLKDAVLTRLWYAFRREGITIPFPIRNVNIHEVNEEQLVRERKQELDRLTGLLKNIDLLASLEDELLRQLAEKMEKQLFSPGEVIVAQGEPGESFFIVDSGKYPVYVSKDGAGAHWGVKVGEITAPNFFGEMSLLTGEPRSATVVCEEAGTLWALKKAPFGELLIGNPKVSKLLAEVATKRLSSNLDKLSKYLSTTQTATMNEKEKTAHVSRQILRQMKDFFGF
ncbi:mechanosensitive ion channel family protein [bacterium]|nr:mechanosensitive ion channel family protein [bacterium]